MKIEPDGRLKVYQWSVMDWNEEYDMMAPFDMEYCRYPVVCGRSSICANNGQCTCLPDLGCSQLPSINCNSLQYHSFMELRDAAYFASVQS